MKTYRDDFSRKEEFSGLEYEKIRKKLTGIYTPLSVAKEEARKRFENEELKKKVEAFWKGKIPEVLRKSPRSVIARHVLSPNFESLRFLELSRLSGLKPLFLEYLNDKFVAENADKYYLCKLFFQEKPGKKWGCNLSTVKALDFNGAEGKKICDLETPWGEKLVSFHHKTSEEFDLAKHIERFDISDYYKENGSVSRKYYLYFFSLFACFGILFENYLLNKQHSKFTRDIVISSFEEVERVFGVRPLIVPLVPLDDEESLYWRYYPKKLESLLKKKNIKKI